MKTKQQFVDEYADRLAGMLLMLFAKNENSHLDMAQRGRWMQHELNRVRPFLGEMYAFIGPEPSISQHIDAVIEWYARATPEERAALSKKFKASLEKEEKKP